MRSGMMALLLAGGLAMPEMLSAQSHEQHHPQGQERSQQGMMQQGQGMMGMMGQGHGMLGMMGMAAGPGPGMILRQKEALNLNESQIQRLEALEDQLAEARETHMKEVPPLRTQAMEAVKGEKPDLSNYESALKKLAEHHVRMQVEQARFSQQALDVLTPEQRSNVRFGMHLMREMMGGRMMQGGVIQGGMMQGGMMGAGGCPMMGEMQKQDG